MWFLQPVDTSYDVDHTLGISYLVDNENQLMTTSDYNLSANKNYLIKLLEIGMSM